MGYEKYLIKHILGIDISNNELPQDKGIIVMNLQTVIAIAELTQNKMAGRYKYITVHNIYTAKTKVVHVHIGDRVDMVAANCFFKDNINKHTIYTGGGALNCHKSDEGELISNTTNYIAIGEMPSYKYAGKCKGCGACTYGCRAGKDVRKMIKWVKESI